MAEEETIIPTRESDAVDVAAAPGDAGDPAEMVARYVPADVRARYEVYSYRVYPSIERSMRTAVKISRRAVRFGG